jgi:hypothetical protein
MERRGGEEDPHLGQLERGPGGLLRPERHATTALFDLSKGTPVDATYLASGFDWSAALTAGLPKWPWVGLGCPPFPSCPAQIKPIPLNDFPACFGSATFQKQVEQTAFGELVHREPRGVGGHPEGPPERRRSSPPSWSTISGHGSTQTWSSRCDCSHASARIWHSRLRSRCGDAGCGKRRS